jgi:hypothetical protein
MGNDRSAFSGFDETDVGKWDARQTGQALKQVLAKVGTLNRNAGNSEQIREALGNDPDVLSGLEHIKELMREPSQR